MAVGTDSSNTWDNLLARTVGRYDPDVLLVNPVKGAPGTRGTEASVAAYADTVGPSYLYGVFRKTFPAEPLYFNVIAAQLRRAGLSCEIADGFCHRFHVEDLVDVVGRFAPRTVAFAVFHNTIADTLAAARTIKALRPDVAVVIGSAYASAHWAEIVRADEVDFVVVGDGEAAFVELALAMREGRDTGRIPGVASMADGRPRLVPPVPLTDLDALAFPARDLMPLVTENEYGVSVYTSRGCAFGNCSFCYLLPYQRVSLQPKWRARSAENVVDEIAELVAEFGLTRVTFVDEDYFGSGTGGVDRTIRIAELLIERRISVRYYVNALIRSLLLIKRRGLLPLFAQSGMDSVFTGFESASRTTLRQFRKPQLPSQYEEVIDGLMEHGIRINPGLISFTPTSSLDDLRENMLLAQRMRYYDLYLFTRRLVDLDEKPDLARALSMAAPAADRGWREQYEAEHPDIVSQFAEPRVASVFQLMRVLCNLLQEEVSAAQSVSPERVEERREQLIERHYEAFSQALAMAGSQDGAAMSFPSVLRWASLACHRITAPLHDYTDYTDDTDDTDDTGPSAPGGGGRAGSAGAARAASWS